MPHLRRVLKLRVTLLAAFLFAVSALAAEAGRFSQAVPTDERKSTGLARLNSDQIGALDALVRRDTLARGSTQADPQAPATFSQRLTADERRVAGIDTLTAEERAKLDAAVERLQSAALARTLLAPPVYVSRSRAPVESETRKKKESEIHGSFTLGYSWGSGGYSAKTGAMEINWTDPSGKVNISIGYSETHVKGGDGIYALPDGVPYRP
jgi:hypothetical protein